MKRSIKYLLPMVLVLSALFSCNNGDQDSEDEPGVDSTTGIVITKEQIESSGMKLGDPVLFKFQQSIHANGHVSPSLSGWAKVSTPISGRVKQINFRQGDLIKKGQVLFSVESKEIIMLQQQYAESFTQLKAIQKSYDRQKTLSEENVTSEKDFLKAESDYNVLLVQVEGLKAQLKMINIDHSVVEKGQISTLASVYAPISGVVADQNLVLGEFIEPNDDVVELIDADLLQLNIHVFERDLKNIQIGQSVIFSDPNNTENAFHAVISQVGRSIDPDTKTVQCIASISSNKLTFTSGLFVEAEIITCEREALAIPKEAFVEEDGIFFVLKLISEKEGTMNFQKTPVKVGVIQGDMGEILNEDLKDILTVGGYNILSQE